RQRQARRLLRQWRHPHQTQDVEDRGLARKRAELVRRIGLSGRQSGTKLSRQRFRQRLCSPVERGAPLAPSPTDFKGSASMSETTQTVRRTVSQPMTMLKAVTGMSGVRPVDTPANEPTAVASRAAPTIISASTEMKGSITTTDSVEIRGSIEGDVR